MLDTSDELYVYLRRYDDDTLLVVNSFSRKKQTFNLAGFDVLDVIISNQKTYEIKQKTLHLKPYESIVFKVKENL
jgi:glycosidase